MTLHRSFTSRPIILTLLAVAGLVGGTVSPGQATAPSSAAASPGGLAHAQRSHTSRDVAHDESAPLRQLAAKAKVRSTSGVHVVPERGSVIPAPPARKSVVDSAVQARNGSGQRVSPIRNFDGLSSQNNFDVLGGRVNPPDPNGAVGPTQYVEMVNLVFAVYSKTGQKELGPTAIGTLWSGFSVPDCAKNAGDPVVLYDQHADRWILTQFTSAGPNYWNCVAISTTGDATGSYYRYAFSTGVNFPDYPKYGVWSNTYTITTREFGPTVEYGIGVYGLEKSKMLLGKTARVTSFYVDGNVPANLPLVGDGLLPADLDGSQAPPKGSAIPLVGSQDDDWSYGATFDALNVWNFKVKWGKPVKSSLTLADQLAVKPFDTNFPCSPDSRDCLAQPGITNPAQFLDTLATRQRVTFRLAYRNFGTYESLVTNQTVESRPGVAGARWYELRRDPAGAYSVYQQSTYSPKDGVNRWMGSIAQDKNGSLALGYSVVNGTDVYPGIRFTGRSKADPLGKMTLREGTIVKGSGVQTDTNSRWGDYTAMTIDPGNDCTMWYVNEYYTAASQASSSVGWLTRIASFKMPGC